MKTFLTATLLTLLTLGTAQAMTAEDYETLIRPNQGAKGIFLATLAATAHYASQRAHLYCAPANAPITDQTVEGIIDSLLAGMRAKGNYDPMAPVEALVVDTLMAKFPCK